MTLLTAKQIAERIAASAEDVPSSMERVRHWTRERLLIPVGEANPGPAADASTTRKRSAQR